MKKESKKILEKILKILAWVMGLIVIGIAVYGVISTLN